MQVTVQYLTVLRRVTQKRQESLTLEEDSTLEDMLTVLAEKYGEKFQRYASSGRGKKGLRLIFLLNGQDVGQLDGLKTRLHNGDKVEIIPPIAGG